MITHRPGWDAEQAAEERLRKRLAALPQHRAAAAMISTVASYAPLGPAGLPGLLMPPFAAGAGDIADALTLTGEVRYQLEEDEMRLIAHGLARGLTWDQLGEALSLNSGNAARARYGRLRESHQAWAAPRRHAARWAAGNPAKLRAAVDRVLGHRSVITATRMLAASAVTADDLATVLETGPAPETLYWAAYGAVAFGLRSDSMSTPAGQALIALRKLVTAPN